MTVRVAIPDLISPSYFPAIAAVQLGYFRQEGYDADIELVFPVTTTYERLRDGEIDFVGGAAHATLYAFPGWQGSRIVCALSRHMYWFLVVRSDLGVATGDLAAVAGLRIAAAPGPVDGLRRMLQVTGLDPDNDVELVPVPAAEGAGVSFGVAAAQALAEGKVDAFWANGMGAEVAVRAGTGTVVVDARRGGGPAGSQHYTFPALVVAERMVAEDPDRVAAGVRAVTSAQRALREAPSRATGAVTDLFGDHERGLIADLIARDAPFYDPRVTPADVTALTTFAHDIGLLDAPSVPYEDVVLPSLGS